jgi:hypothetical protein
MNMKACERKDEIVIGSWHQVTIGVLTVRRDRQSRISVWWYIDGILSNYSRWLIRTIAETIVIMYRTHNAHYTALYCTKYSYTVIHSLTYRITQNFNDVSLPNPDWWLLRYIVTNAVLSIRDSRLYKLLVFWLTLFRKVSIGQPLIFSSLFNHCRYRNAYFHDRPVGDSNLIDSCLSSHLHFL